MWGLNGKIFKRFLLFWIVASKQLLNQYQVVSMGFLCRCIGSFEHNVLIKENWLYLL